MWPVKNHYHRKGFKCNACEDMTPREKGTRTTTHAAWDIGKVVT